MRLELMYVPAVLEAPAGEALTGYAHPAFAGSPEAVDALTDRLRQDGHRVVSAPRRRSNGYYESVVLDPDGNRIEIAI